MIPAQQVVELALAGRQRRCDETIVIVTDRAEASLRWAGNSMTTNGVSTTRSITVISIVRKGDTSHTGVRPHPVRSTRPRSAPWWPPPQQAAHAAPEARDSAPLLSGTAIARRLGRSRCPRPGPRCSPTSPSRCRGASAAPTGCTATPTTSSRRRSWPPRPGCAGASPSRPGSVEINAKRDGASAWAGVSTPWFVDVPTDSMLDDLSMRLGWAQRTVELPAGRYETMMPPSTVADMMIYLGWSMDGRGAQEGRTALSAPGGGTRVGEKLTDLPLTMYSDPFAPGLECAPFVAAAEQLGADLGVRQRNGHRPGRLDSRRHHQRAGLSAGRGRRVRTRRRRCRADNLLMTGGTADLADMVAATERGLLLTTLWYIRDVDPTTLLLTGLTRDGVYLIEDGEVTAAVNNFRFNESPLDLLRRATEAGVGRGDAAARVGRLGHPRGDAVPANPRLPHVIGEPGAIIHRWSTISMPS